MNCKKISAYLFRFIDGELSPAQEHRVRTHLGACSACREKAAAITGLYGSFDSLEKPQPSLHIQTRLSARIRAWESERTVWNTAFLRLQSAAGYLGTALLFCAGAAAGLYLGGYPEQPRPSVSSVSAVTAREAYLNASGLHTFDDLEPASIGSVYAVLTLRKSGAEQ